MPLAETVEGKHWPLGDLVGGCKEKERDVEIYADDPGACSRGGKGLFPQAVRQEGALTNSLKMMGLITQ